ncbi:hypothetical protein IW261DRAFT_1425330 [Armillaria novae-zelandiae]|uniref:Uncharacterized protein n=1 Tax=Armillaria novae-zelandiae TaxID=153914 RepID=A0AA39NT52_9AGAR|nr:hypothetical protein IW261DRAFT_1425330 [Armillaria novae-zelandiae]
MHETEPTSNMRRYYHSIRQQYNTSNAQLTGHSETDAFYYLLRAGNGTMQTAIAKLLAGNSMRTWSYGDRAMLSQVQIALKLSKNLPVPANNSIAEEINTSSLPELIQSVQGYGNQTMHWLQRVEGTTVSNIDTFPITVA